MAYVFERGGKWVIKWKDGTGRYRQRRSGCATKLQARILARELERKAEYQRAGLEPMDAPSQLTFGELLDWYWENFGAQLRSRGERSAAERHLRPTLGSLTLPEITAARTDEVLSTRVHVSGKELSPKSLNNLQQGKPTRALEGR